MSTVQIRTERGQATVLTVIFLVALMGAVALVLDVGSWFREQRDTQSAADAAALAAAQALPDNPGSANGLALQYLNKNGGGGHTIEFSSQVVANDTVTVEVERDAPGVFTKFFGVNSVDVHGRATARTGGMSAAKYVAPIVVNLKHPKLQCGGTPTKPTPCFGDPTELTLINLKDPASSDAAGSFGLINLETGGDGNIGADALAKWVEKGFDQYMKLGNYAAAPSANFNNSQFRSALDFRLGDDLLFPIYKQIVGPGQNAEYEIVGWVGFEVTSYKATGSDAVVKGSFTEVVWEGIQSSTGSNLNFGTRTIALVE
jgi:secretion/DNA translocation related TadE-like protein